MVCTLEELEEVREKERKEKDTSLDNDEVWWALDVHNYVNPLDELYSKFESASPFEEDVDFEPGRQIIALNMYLDPDTTTWYGLRKPYSLLMRPRRQEDRRNALRQCILALKLGPKMAQYPNTRQRWLMEALATSLYSLSTHVHIQLVPFLTHSYFASVS